MVPNPVEQNPNRSSQSTRARVDRGVIQVNNAGGVRNQIPGGEMEGLDDEVRQELARFADRLRPADSPDAIIEFELVDVIEENGRQIRLFQAFIVMPGAVDNQGANQQQQNPQHRRRRRAHGHQQNQDENQRQPRGLFRRLLDGIYHRMFHEFSDPESVS